MVIGTARLPGAPSLLGQAGEVLGDLYTTGKSLSFGYAVTDFSFNWLTWAWASSLPLDRVENSVTCLIG